MAESLHILLGTSACLQWLCHSGERIMARGPLVRSFYGPVKQIEFLPNAVSRPSTSDFGRLKLQ